MAAEARLTAVVGTTRRTMDVSREWRCARSAGGPCVGTIPRNIHARAHLQSAWHERHRFPRTPRENRPLARLLLFESADQPVGFLRRSGKQRVAACAVLRVGRRRTSLDN